ncbi:MAG TPA: ankyrin repeat domain-containing protein [Methylophilaceae bacterium]|jgi:hypothetical protein
MEKTKNLFLIIGLFLIPYIPAYGMSLADQRLIDAVTLNDIEGVRKALSAGANPNGPKGEPGTDEYSNIPIDWAINNGQNEIVKLLVSKGAKLDIEAMYGQKPIDFAMGFYNTELVKFLFVEGLKNHAYGDGSCLLNSALVWRDNPEYINYFLDQGIRGDCIDTEGHNAIYDAVQSGMGINGIDAKQNIEIIRRLISAGVKVNPKDIPLYIAARRLNIEQVKFLISLGADVNGIDPRGETALFSAIHAGSESRNGITKQLSIGMMQILIGAGANVNAENKDGARPLDMAAWNNETYMVKLLLSKGALVNNTHESKTQPIQWALKNKNSEMISALVAAGAKLPESVQK